MFKCEIDTRNSAFCAPVTGEENKFYEGIELVAILSEVQRQIGRGLTSGDCIDVNGNKVGAWSR